MDISLTDSLSQLNNDQSKYMTDPLVDMLLNVFTLSPPRIQKQLRRITYNAYFD